MDHLNLVDQIGQFFHHGSRVSRVEWLAELFDGVEVLEVIFSLIGGIGDAQIQFPPLLPTKETDIIRASAKITTTHEPVYISLQRRHAIKCGVYLM